MVHLLLFSAYANLEHRWHNTHKWLAVFLRLIRYTHDLMLLSHFIFSLFQGVRPDHYRRAIGYARALIISSECPVGSQPQHVALCATFVLSHLPLNVLSLGPMTLNQRPSLSPRTLFRAHILSKHEPYHHHYFPPHTHSHRGMIHFWGFFCNIMCVPFISPESIFRSLCSSNKSRWSLSATQRASASRGRLRMTRNCILMSYNYSIILWRKCHYTF